MIIDSHVYCFEPADSPRGYKNSAEHLRWVQAAHATHHQPAFRIGDRSRGASDVLAPHGHGDLSQLPDLRFRINHPRGRVVWNYEGDEYTKHFYPPNLRGCEFTPFSLNCEMDYAGVDMALLHTDPMLGRDSTYQMECYQRFPDRLRSMVPVDEWRIRDNVEAVIDELTKAVCEHGLHAIKFNSLTYMTSPDPWDDGFYRPFWEAATSLNVPVFFTLGSGPEALTGRLSVSQQVEGYLNELRILTSWMERYPDAVCSLTHGFPWRLFLEGGCITLPESIWEPFQNPNLSLEVCFPVRLGDVFDFPYRELWPTLESIIEHIGADHLLWGTDMPFQNRFCTYRQSRDWIEKYCTFITQDDLALIMGGTAARILGI